MRKFKRKVQDFLKRHWLLELLVFLIYKPKLFLFEYLYKFIDFNNFRKSFELLKKYHKNNKVILDSNVKNILFVPGKNMNLQWLQLWAVLGEIYRQRGHRIYAVTSKSNPIQNNFLKLFKCELIHIENLKIDQSNLADDLKNEVKKLNSFEKIKDYKYLEMPIGKMALSTYSRLNLTGILDLNTEKLVEEVQYWVSYLLKTVIISQKTLKNKKISMLIFTEVFMEEYGAIYYAALKMNLNIIRMAGTVRDNAIVAQHMTDESDRTHFSSFSKKSWELILKQPMDDKIYKDLEQNFNDRYGDKWALSKRNQPNTKKMSIEEGKALTGVPKGKRVAIIYSHILYDTLFFNGEDIYKNYADWLIETVKAACKNDNLYWLIKIHPSNLWRGELDSLVKKGVYEEIRIIEKEIGKLPDHVDYIYPNTPISPYTWLNIADIGITTRGTSGIELGALGKIVLTAGTGRYENIGFTINSNTRQEYEKSLHNIHNVISSNKSIEIGKRFAYSTFCLKPFTLDFMEPHPRTGKKEIMSTDDLVYSLKEFDEIPLPISRFINWSFDKSEIDFLNPWNS